MSLTLAESLVLVLARTGLNTSSTPFVDRARQYWNEGAVKLSGEREWQWLFKQATLTLTSGTRSYSLAADVGRPLSFRHTTDDVLMDIINVQEADRADPHSNASGAARGVDIIGKNAATGAWDVDLVPTPDTSSETVTYRYFANIGNKTSSNDTTDLLPTMPEDAQFAVIDWATGRYKGEKGDAVGEKEEIDSYGQKVRAMKKIDGETDGTESFRLTRRDSAFPQIALLNVSGTLG